MVNFDDMQSNDRRKQLKALREYLIESLKEEELPATGKAALVRLLLDVNTDLTASGGTEQRTVADEIAERRRQRQETETQQKGRKPKTSA